MRRQKRVRGRRTVTALQVRRAYEARYHERMADDMTYQAAADRLGRDMGLEAAADFMESQSNDPAAPESGGEGRR